MVKKILLVLLAVVALWAAITMIRVFIFSGRAGKIIERSEPFTREVANPKMKILVVGDSLAYGTGASSADKSIAGLIAQQYPDAEVVNMARNGKRTNELAAEVKALEGHYDLSVVVIGGNDILRPWVRLGHSADNLRTIYTSLSERSDHVIAFTTGDFKYTTFFIWPINLYFSDRSVYLRNQARDIAADIDNVTYVDIVRYNQKIAFDDGMEAADHLHLSDKGYRYWFTAAQEAFDFSKLR